jgi:hypothetical protein
MLCLNLDGANLATQLLNDAVRSEVVRSEADAVEFVRGYFDAHAKDLSHEQLHWLLMVMCSLVSQKPVEQAL